MKSEHFTYDDAVKKLAGSIILYKNHPHHVRSNDNAKTNLFLSPIGKDFINGKVKEIKVHFNDKELDISIPILGYCNYGYYTYYLSRALGRINKQGISRDTIHSIPAFFPDDLLYSESMLNTIKGIYPSFEECLEIIGQAHTHGAAAFHRYFALTCQSHISIDYRGRSIGSLDPKKKSINIFPGEQASFFDRLIKELNISYEVQ